MSADLKVPLDVAAPMKLSHYRPDVDGLRAVAVLAVLVYHIDEDILPGGYRGVDVFFVISGYVVLGSLLNHMAATTCELLLDFYARRIKRLWPVLLLTVLLTSTMLVILFPASLRQRDQLFTGMLALAGWTNNYFASLQESYFDNAVDALQTNPFMHTWSLGVEEQFYLAFAPLVVLLYGGRVVRNKQTHSAVLPTAALSACIVLSLAASAWLSYRGNYMFTFYLMPFRGWQLLSGALVQDLERFHARAIESRPASALLLIMLELAAVACLTASFVLPADDSLLPVGLLPVTGTVCFLVAGKLQTIECSARAQLPALNALLATRLFTYVGKISYPMYLWHWPVIVLIKLASGFDSQQILASIGLTALLTLISYHGFEYMVRQWRASTRHVYQVSLPTSGAAFFWMWLLMGPLQGKLYMGAKQQPTLQGGDSDCAAMVTSLLSRDFMRSPKETSAGLASFLQARKAPTYACSQCSGATPTANQPPALQMDAPTPCYVPIAFEEDQDRALGIVDGGIAANPCWFDAANGQPLIAEAVEQCMLRPVIDSLRHLLPPGNKPTIFLLGDSHTYAGCLIGLLAAVGDKASVTMAALGSGGPCGVGGLNPHLGAPCKAAFEQTVLTTLKRNLRAGDTVAYCYLPEFVGQNDAGTPEFDEFANYLDETLVSITAAKSASLLLVGSWGHLGPQSGDCLASVNAAKSAACVTSFRPLDTRGESAVAALASTNGHVFFFDTHPLMCASGSCSPLIPGTEVFAFLDDNHLARAGSLYLWPWFDEFLQASKLLGSSSLQKLSGNSPAADGKKSSNITATPVQQTHPRRSQRKEPNRVALAALKP